MNRWLGSTSDSASQASQRDQRAARRIIQSLPSPASASDEEFEECDTSFSAHLNLDGDPSSDVMTEAAAELARQRALPVEDSNFEDDADAWKKELKLQFQQHDVEYWFNSVESTLKKFGINKQWSKKDAIVPLLPEDIVEECKPILRLSETERA